MEAKYEIIPVPLTHHDNIVDAILEYGKDKIGPHDVVCAAESVVAITQDGAKRCEDFKPGFLAKTLCHLFPAKGSISGWYSMQFCCQMRWQTRRVLPDGRLPGAPD